jgi:hypothetical protein
MHERRVENFWVARPAIFDVPSGPWLIIMVGLVGLAGACRGAGDGAPPCSAVAAKFFEIAKLDLASAKVDEPTARAVTDQLPAMRDSLAQACTEGKWSAATRSCLVRANDHGGFETCQQQLTDEQRRDLDRATRGTSETP